MSQENVELVRGLYDLDVFGASSAELDLVFRDYADERFQLRLPFDYPEGEQVFRGREGMSQLIALLHETWGRWRLEPERFLDAGDRVLVFARLLAEGGASGVLIELQTSHFWTVRGGRATSVQVYRDRSEGLKAAGLRE
jgi:ketosteroid isomerase-like protein